MLVIAKNKIKSNRIKSHFFNKLSCYTCFSAYQIAYQTAYKIAYCNAFITQIERIYHVKIPLQRLIFGFILSSSR